MWFGGRLVATQPYPVSINLLKQVYLATHPGAGLQRMPAKFAVAAELLAALDAEREKDDV